MKELAEKSYNRFDLFRNQWAVVTAGTIDNFNGCTVSWGSMGTLWTRGGETGDVITVYIHPGRYTCGFMENSDTFTVSLFPNEYRKALGYVGTHSGRDEDKFSAAGLTPVEIGGSVGYKEASVTFASKFLPINFSLRASSKAFNAVLRTLKNSVQCANTSSLFS